MDTDEKHTWKVLEIPNMQWNYRHCYFVLIFPFQETIQDFLCLVSVLQRFSK